MRIAVYGVEGVTMFHLSVPQMVFGEVARLGLAPWETVLFTEDGGSIRTAEGYRGRACRTWVQRRLPTSS